MTHEQRTKRNDLLVAFISQHRGRESGVSAKEILSHLNEHGFPITHDGLRNLITKLKYERTLPICYRRGDGYFWAKARTDVEVTIKDLEMMIQSMQEHIEHLRKFIID